MFNFMFLALIGISDICLLILYFTVFYKERKKEIPFVLYLLGFIVIESFSIFNLLNFLNVYSIIIHLSFAIYLNIVLLRLVTEKIDRPICSCMDANIETTGSCIETFLVS